MMLLMLPLLMLPLLRQPEWEWEEDLVEDSLLDFLGPPPLLADLPAALPSPISMAIWAKKPEAERAAFSTM
jgi:hypothetical protein